MIRGLPFWNDREKYFIQTNNPTEQYNKSVKKANYTESCGPTSAVNILAAGGKDIVIKTPGGWQPQPEQILWDYLNDPRNFDKFRAARSDISPGQYPGNQIPQYYPVAIKEVFGQVCKFVWLSSFQTLAQTVQKGQGVQLCLKQPGHFIPVVAYDDMARELVYNDPYPDRFPNKDGFNRRLTEAEYKKNVQPYALIYF